MSFPWDWEEAMRQQWGTAHCSVWGSLRKQPNAFAIFLLFLQRGDGGGGGDNPSPHCFKSPEQKAFWGHVTTYSSPERRVLGYSYCKHLWDTAGRKIKEICSFQKDPRCPANGWISGPDGSLSWEGLPSPCTFLEDDLTLTLDSPNSFFCTSSIFFCHSGEQFGWVFATTHRAGLCH